MQQENMQQENMPTTPTQQPVKPIRPLLLGKFDPQTLLKLQENGKFGFQIVPSRKPRKMRLLNLPPSCTGELFPNGKKCTFRNK